ncbi:MAG TPA: hypothetical protein VN088_02260 [Nocardioides sp.]|nr:hypothetical protein [Nocardioides sp.]
MRNRFATAICAATALAALVVQTAATAALTAATASTQTITPSNLSRGAAPRADFLGGRVLHSSTGVTRRLPSTWRPGRLQLVGRVGSAWYVQRWDAQHYRGWLYRATTSSLKRIGSGSNAGSGELGWYLTSDKRAIVHYETDGYGGCTLQLLDLTGQVRAHHGCGYDGNYIGATSAQVWYTPFGTTPTQRWTVGGTAIGIGVKGVLADPVHDVLFLRPTSSGPGGPTSLSAPGTPAWTAAFRAVAVSPDGTYVAGLASGTVQIRRMRDGTVVRRFAVGTTSGLTWETDTRVLIAMAGTKDWIVRCSLAGSCNLAAGPARTRYTFAQVPHWHTESMN